MPELNTQRVQRQSELLAADVREAETTAHAMRQAHDFAFKVWRDATKRWMEAPGKPPMGDVLAAQVVYETMGFVAAQAAMAAKIARQEAREAGVPVKGGRA
jgi:hypothetical protein